MLAISQPDLQDSVESSSNMTFRSSPPRENFQRPGPLTYASRPLLISKMYVRSSDRRDSTIDHGSLLSVSDGSKLSRIVKSVRILMCFLILCIAIIGLPRYKKAPVTVNLQGGFAECQYVVSNPTIIYTNYSKFPGLMLAKCMAVARTLQTVRQIVSKILSVDARIVDAVTKFDDLGDSFDKEEILTALQKHFNITIGKRIAREIITVRDAMGFIEKLRDKAF